MRLGRCCVESPCGIVLGDEYRPSFQRNTVIANKMSDRIPKCPMMQFDPTATLVHAKPHDARLQNAIEPR